MSGTQSVHGRTKGPSRHRTTTATSAGRSSRRRRRSRCPAAAGIAYDTPIFTVALPSGTQSGILNVQRPVDGWTIVRLVRLRADAATRSLRVSYDQTNSTSKNLGIGGYDLPERAYTHVVAGLRVPHPGERSARPADLRQHAARAATGRALGVAREHRGADHSRDRRVHERRRAGRGRPARPRLRICVGHRLRPRHALRPRGRAARRRHRTGPTTRRTTSARTVHEPRRPSTPDGRPRSRCASAIR